MELNHLRSKIDTIDNQLIQLINKRCELVSQVGKYKKLKSLPPLDQSRWDEVMKSRIEQGKQCGLSEKLIRSIFEAIHEEALVIEGKIQNE